ncbi:hypothetical protein [Halegenticoccus tardaugens]|uniref:hypothetical protein n=1 Tax=Halegenticoccus tardaugens TaxID=2071624 RepID=UPI00100B3961|nr:hypothetical protein [Halegenticoccus tardaugens]
MTIPAFFVLAIVGGATRTVALGTVVGEEFTDPGLFAALGIGALVSAVVGVVPILGGLFNVSLALLGGGSMVLGLWKKREASS